MTQMNKRAQAAAAAAIAAISLLSAAAPRAMAAPKATTVATDPAGDVTELVTNRSVDDPRIDLLDASVADSNGVISFATHVVALGHAGSNEALSWSLIGDMGQDLLIVTAGEDALHPDADGGHWSIAQNYFGTPSTVYCTGTGAFAYDTASNTVTVTVAEADLNSCHRENFAKGFTFGHFAANASSILDTPSITSTKAHDGAVGTTPYTLSH